jgi:hypothetical protein
MIETLSLVGVLTAIALVAASGVWVAVALVQAIGRAKPADSATREDPKRHA